MYEIFLNGLLEHTLDKEIFEQIVDRYNQGVSIRKLSREFGIGLTKLRFHLVQNNIHVTNFKYCSNGKVSCRKCKQEKNLSDFSKYATYSDRICDTCDKACAISRDLKKLGFETEDYEAFYKLQDGKCAICKIEFGHTTKTGKQARLAFDHCHLSGKARGLLCGKCNRGLGFLENNLDAAIEYLRKSRAE